MQSPRRAENTSGREAPELLPKYRSRSVPFKGPLKRTEPRSGRSRLSRKRGPLIPMGERSPVLVETPEFWDVVTNLREAMKEGNLVEGSPEQGSGHAGSAVAAGNR